MMRFLPYIGSGLLLMLAAGLTMSAVLQDARPEKFDRSNLGQDAFVEEKPSQTLQLTPTEREDVYYAAITDRPLFEISRRPVSQVDISVDDDPAVSGPIGVIPSKNSSPEIRLLGVMIGGARPSAFVAVNGAEPKWTNLGADIEGWTLAEINAESVELHEGDRKINAYLFQK